MLVSRAGVAGFSISPVAEVVLMYFPLKYLKKLKRTVIKLDYYP